MMLFTDKIRPFTEFTSLRKTKLLTSKFKIDPLTMLISYFYHSCIEPGFLMEPKATNFFDGSSNQIFNHVK